MPDEPCPISFPIWVLVNKEITRSTPYPHLLMTRGGDGMDGGIPLVILAFSSPERAKVVTQPGHPFTLVEMDRQTFFLALGSCRYVEDVGVDIGSPQARVFRVEKLLSDFGPDALAQS